MKSDLIDLEVDITATTEKAVCVDAPEASRPVWLPRSQIEIDTNAADELGAATITVPRWLAEERGLA